MEYLINHYERELINIDSRLRNYRTTMSETERLIFVEKELCYKEFIRQLKNIK